MRTFSKKGGPPSHLEITSNRVRLEVLKKIGEDPDRVERVLNKLIKDRLVRLTRGEAPEDTQVEIAHEALIRNWPMLVDWLEEERAQITIRRRLEAKAAEWVRLGRGTSGLLDETQLREAEQWLKSQSASDLGYDESLSALAQESRRAIKKVKHDEMVAKQHRVRQLLYVLVALSLLLIVSVASAAYAFQKHATAWSAQESAEDQRKVAEDQRKVAEKALENAKNQKMVAEKALEDTKLSQKKAEEEANRAMNAEARAKAAEAEARKQENNGFQIQ